MFVDHPSFSERTVKEQPIYQGRIINLVKRTVELSNGRKALREIVEHPGAVAILAQVGPSSIWCVEQFRAPIGQILLEIPAGKLERGETPETCARRELSEETGFTAEHWVQLFDFYTSPGFANERIYLFHATGMKPGQVHLDEDEFMFGRAYHRHELMKMLDNGQIRDAKTLIALQWWLRREERADL